jgi:sugar porter (SP) family MFS transporter
MITATQSPSSKLKASYNLGYVWLISIVAAMGGLLFGWDWVVIGGAKPFFQRYFELNSEAQIGWANSCALIGCLAGALVAGALSDKFGRKRLLIIAAMIFAVTSLGNALTGNFTVFIAWRIFGGVAIGLASSLSPMYIAEIAPAQIRGKLVAINQLTVVIGILLAQYINWFLVRDLPAGATDEFIRNSWFGHQGWRWMFGLTAAPALFFFIGMFLVPESPRWLAKNGKSNAARAILKKIGGENYASLATAEIQSTLASEEIQHVRFADLLEPRMRKVIVLGVVLAVFQQWCGINVIFNYAEEIFHAAGYDISTVLKNIAWTGSVNLAAAHAVWVGGARNHLCRDGLLLLQRCQRIADAAFGLGGDCLLCDVACAGHVGGDFRNFSEPYPWRGNGRGRVITLDCVFSSDLHLSHAERATRFSRNLLALWCDLCRRICLCLFQTAGNQGQNTRTD